MLIVNYILTLLQLFEFNEVNVRNVKYVCTRLRWLDKIMIALARLNWLSWDKLVESVFN